MADNRLLIAGLGNPGTKYAKTRHNAGFLAVDHFADVVGEQIGTEKMQGVYGAFRTRGKQVIILKPQTFMNRSGECIALYARYFDISVENILVIHDDLDLAPGRVKIVAGGGAGGHNGVSSTIQHLGTKDFGRIKIGIGRPSPGNASSGVPVEKFVLSRFSDEEWQMFQENLEKVTEGIRLFIDQDIRSAMNRINAKASQNGQMNGDE